MKVITDSKTPKQAFVILILQVIAWSLILSCFTEDYSTGNDAAGTGMARGFAVFFVMVPCMVFIFFTTVYVLKQRLPAWFRFTSLFNYMALFLTIAAINW